MYLSDWCHCFIGHIYPVTEDTKHNAILFVVHVFFKQYLLKLHKNLKQIRKLYPLNSVVYKNNSVVKTLSAIQFLMFDMMILLILCC